MLDRLHRKRALPFNPEVSQEVAHSCGCACTKQNDLPTLSNCAWLVSCNIIPMHACHDDACAHVLEVLYCGLAGVTVLDRHVGLHRCELTKTLQMSWTGCVYVLLRIQHWFSVATSMYETLGMLTTCVNLAEFSRNFTSRTLIDRSNCPPQRGITVCVKTQTT